MFSDSESEDEAPAPPPAPARKRPAADDDGGDDDDAKRARAIFGAPPADASDSEDGGGRDVGDGWRREDWRDEALARAGAGGAARGSFLDKIAGSFVDPRVNARSRAEGGDGGDDDAPARRAAAPSGHWSRDSARQARVREERLRSNPSGADGRAAYDRPSMHGREVVISVGPSSLPANCRVTKSRIPPANAKWN